MDKWRGRPLAWTVIILSGWISGRMMLSEHMPALSASPASEFPKLVSGPDIRSLGNRPAFASIAPSDSGAISGTAHTTQAHLFPYSVTPVARPWAAGGQPSGFPKPLMVAAAESPESERGTTPLPLISARKAGTFSLASVKQDEASRPKRIALYAYSFWRAESHRGTTSLAPAAQYGGSQSGLMATWDPLGNAGTGPALLARVAVTPDGQEREWALGTRWQPDRKIPVSLSVERRIRRGQSDAIAAYLAGGLNETALGETVRLDAFGQVGFLRRDAPGPGRSIAFYDGHIRATRSAFSLADAPVTLGVGGWAGGQSGTNRLDIGPTAGTSLKAGKVVLHLQLDWRFRLAGNTRPNDGPALTVSTGF